MLYDDFHCFFFFASLDEFSKTSTATSQWHYVQADIRGAGEQHPARHHECDIRLRGGEEERRLQQTPGVSAAGRQLHERRLEERPDVWFQHQLPLQGNDALKIFCLFSSVSWNINCHQQKNVDSEHADFN